MDWEKAKVSVNPVGSDEIFAEAVKLAITGGFTAMPNLLYVTNEALEILKNHRAHKFWFPIVQIVPIRNVPVEERAFHAHEVKVENDYIYLTVDMKFVYCRDNTLSFLYAGQDLSFRFTVSSGVLRTVDGKQFSAIIGRIAKVTSTSEVELVNTGKVYHPMFDAGEMPEAATATTSARGGAKKEAVAEKQEAEVAPLRKRSRKPTAEKVAGPETVIAAKPSSRLPRTAAKPAGDAVAIGKYQKKVCDEIIAFRSKSKKSYAYLGKKYSMPLADIKQLFLMNRKKNKDPRTAEKSDGWGSDRRSGLPEGRVTGEKAGAIAEKGRRIATSGTSKGAAKRVSGKTREAGGQTRYSPDLRAMIVRMKKVSKKSYKYLAEKFDIPIEDIHKFCSENLKRPRKNVKR